MWCAFVDDASITPPQVAFSIGRDVGPAVTRNRLRRRLRSILAANDVPNGLLLFGVKPTLVELTFDDLQTRTTALLDAAHGHRAAS
jgi:ribonuclease P protein component